MAADQKIKIIQYTDPLCTWCYGMEPTMRKIGYLLGDKVEIVTILGMLIGDVRDIVGRDEHADARFVQFKEQMSQGIKKAANRTGVPIDFEAVDKLGMNDITSVPMCLAYKAMHIQNREASEKFLRRMREARYAEGRTLVTVDDLVQLAAEFPVDLERFKKDMTDGTAEELYSADLITSSQHQVRTYPTYNVTYGKAEKSATGYSEFAFFKSAIAELTDGEVVLETPEYSLDAAVKFVSTYGNVMAREIQVLFDLTDEELAACVDDLLAMGTFEKVDGGSSYFVKAKPLSFCNPATGECLAL